MVYKRNQTTRFGPREIAEVELVYKGQQTGELYLVRPDEQQIACEFDEKLEFWGVPETRLILFESEQAYIRFFSILNEHKLAARISNEMYIAVLEKIRCMRGKFHSGIYERGYYLPRNDIDNLFQEVTNRLRQELYSDPLLNLIW